jgi:SAM-dependent methyltransferase
MKDSSSFWIDMWNRKSTAGSDFEATGRGTMDLVGFLYTLKETIEALELRRSESRVLDIGCGTGIIPLALSPWVKGVVGVDLSKGMAARALKNCRSAENLSFCTGNITSLPVRSASFDRVLAYSVLQYLNGPGEVKIAFTEVARALKPGGVAFLAANPDPGKKKLFEQKVKERDIDERQKVEALRYVDLILWMTGEEMLQIASRAGLSGELRPIHSRIWQSFYMYDLLLRKNHG